MEEEKTTTTKRVIINLFKVLFIGALVAISSGALFEVDNYEYINNINSLEYRTHKAKYKPIITNRNFVLKNLLNDLESGNITKQEYIIATREIQETSKLNIDEYTKGKVALQESYKFRGWNGYYYFRLAIDPHLMSFVMGLMLLYIIYNPITAKWKKLAYSIFSGIFLFTSTYFILQALFSQQVFQGDFPENWYKNMLVYIPILVSVTLPLLFYYYLNVEQKLKSYIRILFTYIYANTDDIKADKQEKHKLERGKLIDKGLKINA